MASPTLPEVPAGPDHDPDDVPRRRVAVIATLVGVAVLVSGWVYVLFVYDPGLMIDELADRTFPTQAEQVCAAARAELAELPPAEAAQSADERADVVARSNLVFAQMLADLGPLVPEGPDPSDTTPAAREERKVNKGIQEWVDDWGTYLGNRVAYVENLRVDDDARFLESTKGSDTRGITRAINAFAEVNRMESCTTPADLS
ncbi:MAG: hypothetical protein ACK4V6_08010 [Microthrixaceae bacterium]